MSMPRASMLSAAALLSSLSLAFALHTPVDPQHTGSVDVDSDPQGLTAVARAVSINGNALMRSETKTTIPQSDGADKLRLLQQRREAQEEEFAVEFQRMLDGNWVNMANMNAAQSSTFANEDDVEVGPAPRAIDGNKGSATGASCTNTKFENNPWWEVDMGSTYHLSQVEITARGDRCGEQRDVCPPLHVMVDETACHDIGASEDQVNHTLTNHHQPDVGESRVITCKMVGQAVKVALPWHVEDELLLCEVRVRASAQLFLEIAVKQCESHSVLAQPIKTDSDEHGRCVAGLPSFGNVSDISTGFHELVVGQASDDSDGELQATFEECEEHLLRSDEQVEGAVWEADPAPLDTKGPSDSSLIQKKGSPAPESQQSFGTCRLLMGRRVVAAEPAEGAKCFRKLHCPHDAKQMAKWKKLAGVGLKKGESWR